ncbi:MAG: hemolysin III family protein [Clostridia bacterium]|nr:hemolysin III family protein [Clostridia bacterium]
MCDHSLPNRRYYFHLKDPGSAITHFFGLVGAVMAMPALLIHGAGEGYGTPAMAAFSVFLLSMVGLYAASTAYHAFDLEHGRNRILKKLDHIMIFFLIAGTYTPVCVITLAGKGGLPLLVGVWAVALAGLVLKLCWVYHPKWLSSVLYIGMGWLCLTKLPALWAALPREGFLWLLSGGVLYTVGGVVYALKLEKLNALHPHFGSHEIFHLFVLGGSACHYLTMFYL